jgi:PD-(D/E)XK endonuclease
MMNPKMIGEISEAQVLAAFLQAGEVVLLPSGDNQRYDRSYCEFRNYDRSPNANNLFRLS